MAIAHIRSEEDIQRGLSWLTAQDPRLKEAAEIAGPVPLRLRPDGFEGLLSAIVSQQLSTAAAASIWARMQDAGYINANAILEADEDSLRQLGLSRPKIRYARALAEAGIDFVALRAAPDAEVISTLTAVKGIGVWTAEIYAMFALGRADVFAPGDLALQEAARMIYALDTRPSEKELRKIAEALSPWRAVAARLFFSYYSAVKKREGIT